MTLNLHLPSSKADAPLRPTITVIGVGGAGGNAVNNMISAKLEGVSFAVANTDAQALEHALTERKIQLGGNITKGLGAGASPDVGRAAAEEAAEEIESYLRGSNMVFITAGMGGGTGTGAAPVVAKIARESGILTVGVVTKPFQFEGTHRMRLAESGIQELQQYVDTLIVIPNQNLFRIANERTTFADAFKMADEVLHSGVRGVTDLIVKPGLVNLDFADIRAVMREMGKAMMGTGEATGERRALEAAEAAISNPLLDDVSLKGAKAVLINITGGLDMTLFEVDEAANRIREEVDTDANIIFGSTFNEVMNGTMRVSVVATGIDAPGAQQRPPLAAAAPEVKRPLPYSAAAAPKMEPQRLAKPTPATVNPRVEASRSEAPVAVQREAQPAEEPRVVPFQTRASEPARPAAKPVDTKAFQGDYVATYIGAAVPTQQPAATAPAASASAASTKAPADYARMPLFESQEPRAEFPSPRAEQRHEMRAEPSAHAPEGSMTMSFFQKMASVGKALSPKADAPERPMYVQERAKVVEQPAPRPDTKTASQEEEYLEIPAFLRRQAN